MCGIIASTITKSSKERRTITHINHIISKELVQLAIDYNCGIRLEDLSNIRKTSKQRKKNKSDAAVNRDFWCYYQLENFIFYKAKLAGIPVEKVPAPYTSWTLDKQQNDSRWAFANSSQELAFNLEQIRPQSAVMVLAFSLFCLF